MHDNGMGSTFGCSIMLHRASLRLHGRLRTSASSSRPGESRTFEVIFVWHLNRLALFVDDLDLNVTSGGCENLYTTPFTYSRGVSFGTDSIKNVQHEEYPYVSINA